MGLFSVVSTSVLSLTKNVALSAARCGVRVNAVCLGMVRLLFVIFVFIFSA